MREPLSDRHWRALQRSIGRKWERTPVRLCIRSVPWHPHLGQIESTELRFFADSEAHDGLLYGEEHPASTKCPTECDDRTDDLRNQLCYIAEEQAPGNCAAVIHRSVGEQPERELSPHTVDTMDGDRAD